MKACKSIPSKAVGVAAMHSWMHEFRIPTRIFGLKVEETSEAEALHFPRRKNVIPGEKKVSLGPFQEFNTVKFLLNGLNSVNFHYLEQLLLVILKKCPLSCIFLLFFFVFLLPVPVHFFIQPPCPLQQTGLENRRVPLGIIRCFSSKPFPHPNRL